MKKILLYLLPLFITSSIYAQQKIGSNGDVISTGNYPSVKSSSIKGSLHSFQTIAQRDSLLANFRDTGMLCWVADSSKYYLLEGGIANSNWVEWNKASIGLGNVPNVDATNPSNIVQTSVYRFVTDGDKNNWNNKYSNIAGDTLINQIITKSPGLIRSIYSGTGYTYSEFQNAGGQFYIGQESSVAGSFFPGSSAYANVFYTGQPIQFLIGGKRFEVNSNGAALNTVSDAIGDFVTRNTSTGQLQIRTASEALSDMGGLSSTTAASTYQPKITLTTTGNSGAATLIGTNLNIPQYVGNPGTVTSFSKTDGYGIISTVTNPTTTPNYSPKVDTSVITSKPYLNNLLATKLDSSYRDSVGLVYPLRFDSANNNIYIVQSWKDSVAYKPDLPHGYIDSMYITGDSLYRIDVYASGRQDTTQVYGGNGGGGANYTLPIASVSTLGGIKVGTNLSIDGSGVLSSTVPAQTWTSITGKPTFATVATSGSYTDLINKPTIPTNNNQLTNGSGFITNATGLITSGTNVTITGSGTSGAPYVINSTGSGGSNTASNGLTVVGSDVQLGGTLSKNTTIDITGGKSLTFTGDNNTNLININGGGAAIYALRSGGLSLLGEGGLYGGQLTGINWGGNFAAATGSYTNTGNFGAQIGNISSDTSGDVTTAAKFYRHPTQGAPGVNILPGFGLINLYSLSTNLPNLEDTAATTVVRWSDPNISTKTATYTIQTATNGKVTDKFNIGATGQVGFNKYGSGLFTGTATHNLGVTATGNVIEVPASSTAFAGTYTPNVSGGINLNSTVPSVLQYMEVSGAADVYTVSGKITATSTTSGLVSFNISLPNSLDNFGDAGQAGGSGNAILANTIYPLLIYANTGTQLVNFTYNASASNQTIVFYFSFTYQAVHAG